MTAIDNNVRLQNLERAQASRLLIANMRKQLANGEVTIADLLAAAPFANYSVATVVMYMPRVGRNRVEVALRELRISPLTSCGELTDAERTALHRYFAARDKTRKSVVDEHIATLQQTTVTAAPAPPPPAVPPPGASQIACLLVVRGSRTASEIAAALNLTVDEVTYALSWLYQNDFLERHTTTKKHTYYAMGVPTTAAEAA